ncbi:hypothetical protein JYU34_019424, partial [Plutella xylostella]
LSGLSAQSQQIIRNKNTSAFPPQNMASRGFGGGTWERDGERSERERATAAARSKPRQTPKASARALIGERGRSKRARRLQ